MVRFCVLETKIPNLVYLNFQLSVQEPREHFVSQITELLFLFRRYFSHSLYVTHVLQSLPRVFQTSDCCATGFGVDSTILPIHFPILFLREKVCCRKWYSQGTKVFRGSHKNFHLYKNNCQTIPTYTSCVSKSNELNFGLLFEVLNQNFDDFPLQVCIFFSLRQTDMKIIENQIRLPYVSTVLSFFAH